MRDVQESGSSPLGFTVGENTSDHFTFVVAQDAEISKWEYVHIPGSRLEVLGRIERVLSKSELLNTGMDFESVKKYAESDLEDRVFLCQARSLGSVTDEGIILSRRMIPPGSPVVKASAEVLQKALGYDTEISLEVGNLIDREDVPVGVDINGLRRHLAILAQTGAGKSNAAAVLMEGLVQKGASILVLDPHADYALMRSGSQGEKYAEDIRLFRTPLSSGRYASSSKGISKEFTIRFEELDSDEISEIMGIREEWSNLRGIVDEMRKSMKPPRDLRAFLEAVNELKPEDQRKISGRLRILSKIKSIFSDSTTPMEEYFAPGQLTVLDLSGMDQALANYFANRVLYTIYENKMDPANDLPIFVFVEEAHNFVPPGARTTISQTIRKIAAEGRKFGVFLVVMSQRPGKLDQDVLSQCNSEIILRITNPIDQKAILDSSESISESMLSDLPSLNVGEAILTGQFIRVPTLVRIRKRETKEGGGDVDLIEMLKNSREIRRKKHDPKAFQNNLKEAW